MNALYHLSLEREIVLELNPLGAPSEAGRTPVMHRDTALAVVARATQMPLPFSELINEAGLLTASALEMEYFGCADVRGGTSLGVRWGSVLDSTRNVDPVPVDVPREAGKSGFAFALESVHPIVIGDAVLDDRFTDSQLIGHGIQCGVICPLGFREEQFGAIGVFSTQPRMLTKSDVLFVQSVALLLGPARAHQNLERMLAEHTRFLASAIDSLDALVITLGRDGTVTQINRTCRTVGGYSASELRGVKMARAFFGPGDAETVEGMLQQVKARQDPLRYEAFFTTKLGEQRRINWTFTPLLAGTEGSACLVTGIDVTDQFRAMSKLNELEALRPLATLNPTTNSNGASATPTAPSAAAPDRTESDRRAHGRRPYSCIQSIAPCLKGKLPERDQFRVVRCHDISPRGFSFLLAAQPDFDDLVAAFGSAQARLYLRSRVIHATSLRHEGRNVVLVGCEYTERVRLPWLNPTT